ncbi:D-glycero-beta-D-manno-heptose 1-phosphate adenylyltransferase [Thermosulfuriphilus sp.]
MRIGIIQLIPRPEEPEVNVERAFELAQRPGILDLLVLPELFISGYKGGPILQAHLTPSALNKLSSLAQELKTTVVCGLPEKRPEGLYNTAFVLDGEGLRASYQKIHLFPGLDDPFSPGEKALVYSLGAWRVGLGICFDLRFPELSRHLVSRGANILLYLAQWPEQRAEHLFLLSRARALENQVYLALANATGEGLAGGSRVVAPDGTLLASLNKEEGILVVDLDPSLLSKVRGLFETGQESLVFKRPEAKVLELPALLEEISGRRRQGQRIVFTNGCFDILHAGHARYLNQARLLGDCLVVGLNSDASVRRLKGQGRPINPATDRALLLASLFFVDYVCIFSEDTPEKLIETIRPEILVKGADWPEEKIVGASLVKSYGGKVVRLPLLKGRSTSKIIRRIRRDDQ